MCNLFCLQSTSVRKQFARLLFFPPQLTDPTCSILAKICSNCVYKMDTHQIHCVTMALAWLNMRELFSSLENAGIVCVRKKEKHKKNRAAGEKSFNCKAAPGTAFFPAQWAIQDSTRKSLPLLCPPSHPETSCCHSPLTNTHNLCNTYLHLWAWLTSRVTREALHQSQSSATWCKCGWALGKAHGTHICCTHCSYTQQPGQSSSGSW